ncbi:putative LysR family transcriptional regulator [Frankia sp. AiPs1]|uniref:LysR family transcriptional regulator n=1 Tax=Frankia sp. AiPa1 TaxID=573492 RepID=UPI00202B5509|nr:LysR family transcriptional regulator [Frankia sp. AiPa1]MCL9762451.1 LysR family transcriptional regulator [Frankia sp. AiPa1]
MEMRQLEYFLAVAEEANFTRAAGRVHISQSGVSAQIRALEHELGAELFDRSGRAATLTTAGEAALDPARRALAAVAAVREAVDDVRGLVRGRLAVGMVASCTVEPWFEALAAFHEAHPGVDLSVVEDSSDRLIEQVRTGALELALVGAAADDVAREPRMLPVLGESLVAAVAPGHPLAARPGVTLTELAAYPLACLPTGTGIRAVLERACTAAGVRPRFAVQAAAPRTVADLAARGLGVAILSASMIVEPGERLRCLPIADAPALAMLALVWTATPSPALPVLLRHCRRTFALSDGDGDGIGAEKAA